MESAVEMERARCVRLINDCRKNISGYDSMLMTRLSNMFRNGNKPETFQEQMSSDGDTEYCVPDTVDEERQRCLDCLDLHFDDGAPLATRELLLDLRDKIAGGTDVKS